MEAPQVGKWYGSWRVEHLADGGAWCRCECGEWEWFHNYRFKYGRFRKGGCAQCLADRRRRRLGHPAEYRAWAGMLARCADKRNQDYGGRGITVCERWRLSFDAFLADMGARPTEWHSLDRVNVNGSYEPTNCRWADPKTQARNQRRAKKYWQHPSRQAKHNGKPAKWKRYDKNNTLARLNTQPQAPETQSDT